MSGLPSSWALAAFNDTVETVSTAGHVVETNEYADDGSIPVLTQGATELDGFTDDTSKAFDSNRSLIVFGDHTRAVKLGKPPFAVGPNTRVLAPGPGLTSKYLYYQLLTILPPSRGYGRHYQFLARSQLAIAPLGEQERIVAAIEEQFSRLDAGAAALGRVRQNLKRIRASALESEIRRQWPQRTLEEVCLSVADGDHQPPPQSSSGVPFLVIGNVRSGHIDFSNCRRVSETYYGRLHPKRRPQVGDVLYTVVGSYGIPVLVDSKDPFCVQRHIAILRPSPKVDARYLRYALGTGSARGQADSCATGTAQMTVPLSGLRRMTIGVPTLDEQRLVARRLDAVESAIDRIESDINSFTRRLRTLRSSILAAAFSGKLSLRDPNDEPASLLLQRIALGPSSNGHKAVRVGRPRRNRAGIPE